MVGPGSDGSPVVTFADIAPALGRDLVALLMEFGLPPATELFPDS